MRKEYLVLLAAGCVFANAANVNYDLLGRKGSQMNSPMVYKNVDYSKIKKNELQKNSPLENRSLAKVGMKGNVSALHGAYGSEEGSVMGLVNNRRYFLKHFYSDKADENCDKNNDVKSCSYEWIGYRNKANQSFINVKEYGQPYNTSIPTVQGYHRHQNSPVVASNYPDFVYADWEPYTYSSMRGWSNVNSSRYSLGFQETPANYQADDYTSFDDVNDHSLKLYPNISWLWYNPTRYQLDGTDVGVFLGADALPVQQALGKFVGYIHNNNRDAFDNPSPTNELYSSRSHALITESSKYSVVYVGKDDPEDPAERIPQIYIGVRNNKLKKSSVSNYSTAAKNLDNYIYEYRTAEFVPAGDYGLSGALVNEQAQAANAITVGAIDPHSGRTFNYSSDKNYTNGPKKPEIYNYSNLIKTEDLTRRYNVNSEWNYPQYYGTRMSAAYTAGMVSNLLALNPFFRWHPEVVKAYLLSSITSIPDYEYTFMMHSDLGDFPLYRFNSHYWNGDINKLKTRVKNNKKEIWVVTKNLNIDGRCPSKAAISWLSSGNDIAYNNGKVPQNFDLYAYGCSEADCKGLENPKKDMKNFNFDKSRTLLAKSDNGSKNSYETVSISQTKSQYPYFAFKIVLDSDNSKDNKDQIVLGFNYTACEP